MAKTYSVYEAKAKLSELLRIVKKGNDVVITEHGKPIARVTPVELEMSFEDRLAELKLKGELIGAKKRGPLPNGVSRPGALKRFLEDR